MFSSFDLKFSLLFPSLSLFQLQKENMEDYIEYLKSIGRLDEAAKRLVDIIDDDGFTSKAGKSKHQVCYYKDRHQCTKSVHVLL